MATIYVKNGNWDLACAELKTELDAQDAKFQERIKEALSLTAPAAEQPTNAPAPAAAPQSDPPRTMAIRNGQPYLARSRLIV